MNRLLASFLFLGLVALPLASQADVITFTNAEYSAHAYYKLSGGIAVTDDKVASVPPDSLPINAAVTYSDNLKAAAQSGSALLSASVLANVLNSKAEAYANAVLYFTANSDVQGTVSFDYEAYAKATGDANAWADALFRAKLYDQTMDSYPWTDEPLYFCAPTDDNSEQVKASGTFTSPPLNLTKDHDYQLQVWILYVKADPRAGNTEAWATIENITVNAVPLPSSLLLLSSGIIGLAGWRRFRKD